MINATLRIPASPKSLESILHSLRSLVGPASVAPGCLDCRLYTEVAESPALLLYQQWESLEALERYFRSANCRRLLGVLEAARSAPEIRFDTVSSSRGLELIESALSENHRSE